MLPALIGLAIANPFWAARPERFGASARIQSQTQVSDPDEFRHQKDLAYDREQGARDQAEVAKELIIVNDPIEQARLDRIGHEIADIANHTHAVATWGDKRMNPFDYDFHIVLMKESKYADMVNAFSVRGGHIYVFKGTLAFCQSDDELAGILAHEIAHAAFRHVATLIHQETRLTQWTLPAILLGVLSGGTGLLATTMGGQLATTAVGNGWSVQAEEAADYGGFQYLLKSHYDPTGMLTSMERLAIMERQDPLPPLGIYRDHPPSKDRAESLIRYMNEANVPIHRSHVAWWFRAEPKPQNDGTVEITFGKRPLAKLAGNDALTRADLACQRLNAFFDGVPEAYEVQIGDSGTINSGRKPLIELTAQDAAAVKMSVDAVQKQALDQIRASLFTIGERVWDTR